MISTSIIVALSVWKVGQLTNMAAQVSSTSSSPVWSCRHFREKSLPLTCTISCVAPLTKYKLETLVTSLTNWPCSWPVLIRVIQSKLTCMATSFYTGKCTALWCPCLKVMLLFAGSVFPFFFVCRQGIGESASQTKKKASSARPSVKRVVQNQDCTRDLCQRWPRDPAQWWHATDAGNSQIVVWNT